MERFPILDIHHAWKWHSLAFSAFKDELLTSTLRQVKVSLLIKDQYNNIY